MSIWRMECGAALAEVDRLRAENKALRKRVAELEEDSALVARQLMKACETVNNEHARAEDAEAQLERAKSHVDALNRDGSDIIARLRAENKALNAQLNVAADFANEQTTEIVALRKRVRELEALKAVEIDIGDQ